MAAVIANEFARRRRATPHLNALVEIGLVLFIITLAVSGSCALHLVARPQARPRKAGAGPVAEAA